MFHRSVLFLAGVAALSLSACAPQLENQWMPKGYTYQDDTPLSSAAPSSPWVSEAVVTDTEQSASNTAAWQGAVYELVAQLQPSLPYGSAVSLRCEDKDVSPQDRALDHYLRNVLMQKGYTLTTAEGTGTVVLYKVSPDTAQKGQDGIFNLKAAVVTGTDKDGKPLTSAPAVVSAALPFEKTSYNRWLGYSPAPAQGKSLTPTNIIDRQ